MGADGNPDHVRKLRYALQQGYLQKQGFVPAKLPKARKCRPRLARAPQVPEVALTIRGRQLCWAILKRKKTLENRSWKLKPGWYALHCSSQNWRRQALTLQQKVLCGKGLPTEAALRHFRGQLLGVF